MTHVHSVIVGGGAAGFFAAIACAEANPTSPPMLLEKGTQWLSKVRISGGGRCNVTHACFDPAQLVNFYPRGSKALRGPLTRFQPRDTVAWFASRGVALKTEPDGRMFPTTDSSQTIIDCLHQAAKAAGVLMQCNSGLEAISRRPEGGFMLTIAGNRQVTCDRVLIATGSNRLVWQWLAELGHTVLPPVPSLFTFHVPGSPLQELSGVSVDSARVELPTLSGSGLTQTGPLLVTHWGFSGPAILRLSAWGARVLHDCNYKTTLKINWVPNGSPLQTLLDTRAQFPARHIGNESLFDIPRKLWRVLVTLSSIDPTSRMSSLTNRQLTALADRLQNDCYQIDGKATNKDEFVTCGGVSLDEVNFKTMESRKCPGLHFAGEVLDIDGITGGFNFQSAWTTGYLAGQSLALSG